MNQITPFVTFTIPGNDTVRVCAIDSASGMSLFYQVKENAGSPMPHYSDCPNFASLSAEHKSLAALILATQRIKLGSVFDPGSDQYDHVKCSVGAPYGVSVNYALTEPLTDGRWFIPALGQGLACAVQRKAPVFSVVATKGPGLKYPNTVTTLEITSLVDLERLDPRGLIPWVQVYRRTVDPKLRCIQQMLAQRAIPSRRQGESLHAPILQVPAWFGQEAWDLLDTQVQGSRLDDIDDYDPVWVNFNPET